MACHMVSIFFRQHLTLRWPKFVHIHHQTMYYHIGNVFFVVIRNVYVWIFQVQNQISKIQTLDPPYHSMSINTQHVILCMTDALSMKSNSVNFVRLLQIQLLLKKIIPEKIFSRCSHQLWNFIKTSAFLPFRTLHFIYREYKFLEQITVLTHAKRHLIAIQIFKMCCTVVIMHNVQYPALHTKSNLNHMVIIGMYLLKASFWNTLVPKTKKHPHIIHPAAHEVICFTRFCLITAKKMQLQQLHIANESLIC